MGGTSSAQVTDRYRPCEREQAERDVRPVDLVDEGLQISVAGAVQDERQARRGVEAVEDAADAEREGVAVDADRGRSPEEGVSHRPLPGVGGQRFVRSHQVGAQIGEGGGAGRVALAVRQQLLQGLLGVRREGGGHREVGRRHAVEQGAGDPFREAPQILESERRDRVP